MNGGDVTEGAFDEAIRHAVTKMSSIHFAAAEPYRQRIVQMGEDLCYNHGMLLSPAMFHTFCGDYYRAVEDKMFSENITKVLYPNDEHGAGKELRLEQQFFFVTCDLLNKLFICIAQN